MQSIMYTLSFFVTSVILPLATAIGPSGPTQPGAPMDCILWYSAQGGDTASQIAGNYNIPLETVMDGNPQLSGNPLDLWEGYDYCVPQGSKTAGPPGLNILWIGRCFHKQKTSLNLFLFKTTKE